MMFVVNGRNMILRSHFNKNVSMISFLALIRSNASNHDLRRKRLCAGCQGWLRSVEAAQSMKNKYLDAFLKGESDVSYLSMILP